MLKLSFSQFRRQNVYVNFLSNYLFLSEKKKNLIRNFEYVGFFIIIIIFFIKLLFFNNK